MSPIKPIDASDPDDYIAQIDEPRREQIAELDRLIREAAPGLDRKLQSGMLGYGSYHYRYASGREGDWVLIALASQKRHISLYICAMHDGEYVAEAHRERLPAADIGRSCIRFKRLDDVDLEVLRELVADTAQRFEADPDRTFAQ